MLRSTFFFLFPLIEANNNDMLARHYICIVNTGRGLRTLNMYTQFPAASFPMNSTALDILILFLDQSVPMTN